MTEYHLDSLILAPIGEYHARAVQREIHLLGGTCLILDSSSFPGSLSITFRSNGHRSSVRLTSEERGLTWTLDNRTSIWRRKTKPHSFRGSGFGHPEVVAFAAGECELALLGSLSHCCERFINPLRSHYLTTKLYELKVAADVGFTIPETLVTTDMTVASEFVETKNRCCIHKVFNGRPLIGITETRAFETQADLDDLWRIRHCPPIIQPFVPAVADLRATIVGNEVFCAALKLDPTSAFVDGRYVSSRPVPYTLTPLDIDRLLKLARALGLVYAGVDLRLQEDGDIVFLEANPFGRYLWLESDAGLPISASLARLLLQGSPVRQGAHGDGLPASDLLHSQMSADSAVLVST